MTAAIATAQLVLRHAGMNEYSRRAVETPACLDAIELRQKVMRVRAELPVVPQPLMPTSVDDDLYGWLEDIVQADALACVRAAKYDALSSLITKCETIVQGVVHEKGRMLASLAKDLDENMGVVAKVVERLDGARTAAQAIERGAADAWQELAPLRAE